MSNEAVVKTSQEKKNLIIMIAAFAAVYLIWGSTYLAIKYAIQTMPTFLMAGTRFTIAGIVLYLIARFSGGYEKPKLVHWRTSIIVGTLLLAIGNGGVVLAEHYISSSLAALLVATEPFWVALLGWGFMKTGRPNLKVTAGLLVGFVGVWLLISGQEASSTVESSHQLFGAMLIVIATLGWAVGSLYGSKAPTAKSTVQAAGMQMFSGGVIMLLISAATGEWSTFDVSRVSGVSLFALAYLILFGAIVAYTAYSWLLKNVSPTAVTTYAYVNPAVAVVLGWMIAGESMTAQMLVGAAIIVGSVALITLQKKPAKEIENAAEPAAEAGPAGVRENYSTS
jgi:drug/metabolite transporter (DMT)-like permease